MRCSVAEIAGRAAFLVSEASLRAIPRDELARRWGVTPRAVSYCLLRCEKAFGVTVRHSKDEGYVLVSNGLLDTGACRRAVAGG